MKFAEREGELMQVSLKLENGNDARLLVDAVIDAYIADVVDEAKNNRKRTLGQLKGVYKTIMESDSLRQGRLQESCPAVWRE